MEWLWNMWKFNYHTYWWERHVSILHSTTAACSAWTLAMVNNRCAFGCKSYTGKKPSIYILLATKILDENLVTVELYAEYTLKRSRTKTIPKEWSQHQTAWLCTKEPFFVLGPQNLYWRHAVMQASHNSLASQPPDMINLFEATCAGLGCMTISPKLSHLQCYVGSICNVSVCTV